MWLCQCIMFGLISLNTVLNRKTHTSHVSQLSLWVNLSVLWIRSNEASLYPVVASTQSSDLGELIINIKLNG